MARNRLVISGLMELRDELRNLPTHLRDEAEEIVRNAAQRAKDALIANYPERTGNLKKGVRVKEEFSQFGVSAIVSNRAKHAFIFENGTQARHTDLGANRGSMPPGHVFIPTMMRHRRAMQQELIALVESTGLTVTGTP